MKEFDYIIIGGGCAGLSLAYELEIHNKLENKTLAIIEPRDEYKRDKTWSFWRVSEHNFDDCVIKNWKNFSVNAPNKTNFLECENYPYQSIDSGLFYEKINNSLKLNKNIFFLKELKDININTAPDSPGTQHSLHQPAMAYVRNASTFTGSRRHSLAYPHAAPGAAARPLQAAPR